MNVIYKEKSPLPTESKILIGDELMSLSNETLVHYGKQVSLALAKHTGTMLQYTPEEIVGIIHEGRAVVVDGTSQGDCQAFAQLSPWKNEAGELAAVEFRSWKSWATAMGEKALAGAITLSKELYPGIALYAVVETHNTHAQHKLVTAGATYFPGMPPGMKIELGEGEASVQVLELSGVGGI
jgi:hypothetical protein